MEETYGKIWKIIKQTSWKHVALPPVRWDDLVWGVQAPAKGFMMGSNGRDGDPLGFIENDHL